MQNSQKLDMPTDHLRKYDIPRNLSNKNRRPWIHKSKILSSILVLILYQPWRMSEVFCDQIFGVVNPKNYIGKTFIIENKKIL